MTRNSNKGKSGLFRIIGGQWRGRRLHFTEVQGLRPTMDRVRETLFNWLAADIHGARCLDLFAGSGAVGIEALSRGAAKVDFVEKHRTAADRLQQNLDLVGTGNGQVHQQDARTFVAKPQPPYDIVFLDPPFFKGFLKDICADLEAGGLVGPDTLIYIEAEKQLTDLELPTHWQNLKDKQAGGLSYGLWRIAREGEAE